MHPYELCAPTRPHLCPLVAHTGRPPLGPRMGRSPLGLRTHRAPLGPLGIPNPTFKTETKITEDHNRATRLKTRLPGVGKTTYIVRLANASPTPCLRRAYTARLRPARGEGGRLRKTQRENAQSCPPHIPLVTLSLSCYETKTFTPVAPPRVGVIGYAYREGSDEH